MQEFAFLRLGEFPVNDPDWDVGVHDMLALPHYDLSGLAPAPLDYDTCVSLSTYDRIPKGEVEIRRSSVVTSADGHHLGQVEGFLLDSDGRMAHLVLERGHLGEGRRHDPDRAVRGSRHDAVTLSLSKDAVRPAPRPVPTNVVQLGRIKSPREPRPSPAKTSEGRRRDACRAMMMLCRETPKLCAARRARCRGTVSGRRPGLL